MWIKQTKKHTRIDINKVFLIIVLINDANDANDTRIGVKEPSKPWLN